MLAKPVQADTLVSGKPAKGGPVRPITSPHDRGVAVGEVREADDKAIVQALHDAAKANAAWDGKGGAARATILEKAADLFEANTAALYGASHP